MQKNVSPAESREVFTKILLVMKLILIVMITACMGAYASGSSQTITMEGRKLPLENVFTAVKKQTGFVIFYNRALLKNTIPVTLSVKEMPLEKFISLILKNQPLGFTVEEKTIVLYRKAAAFPDASDEQTEAIPPVLISGVVRSSDGTLLFGATVAVKGAKNFTTTDAKGKFSISASIGDTILITYVGYNPLEIPLANVDSKKALVVELKAIGENLDHLVVIGYGTQRKSDVTGSISSISKETLEKVPAATLDLKLQGRVPGVFVTQTSSEPGGNATVRIRGSNSISGNNEPLYVVDGYSMPSVGEAGGTGDGQSLNVLSGINPDDIESIDVLKDASATAIYGARGANGVVIITTKRGKAGKTSILFETQSGLNKVDKVLNLGNAMQYAQYQNDYAIGRGLQPPYNGTSNRFPKPEDAGEGTRWLEEILENGSTQRYQMSMSGGNSTTRYNLSGHYYKENGVVINSMMQRGNIRLNMDNTISNKLTLATTINLTNASNSRVQPGAVRSITLADAIYLAMRANPIVPVDATGTGEFGGATYGDSDGNFFENPIFLASHKKDLTNNQDYFATLKGTYKVTSDLHAVFNVGSTRRSSARKIYYPRTTALGFQNNGYAFVNSYQNVNYLMEGYLSYGKTIKDIVRVDAVLGLSQQMNESNSVNNRVSSFPNDISGYEALQFGTTLYTPSSSRVRRALKSYYFRSNFSFFGNRYLLTLTGRADGSSVFAVNNKWGIFPSGALAWRVSNEPFFVPLKRVISDLKIRTSYGITGSQAIAPLGSLAIISATNYVNGSQLISGTSKTSMGNRDLKWEQTSQLNIGLDVVTLIDRIKLTAEYYQKNTSDLLQTLSVPTSSGFTTVVVNQGTIRNSGFEFSLSADIVKGRTFSWNASGNMGFNRNKAIDLGRNIIYGLGSPSAAVFIRNIPMTIVKEGYSTPMYYGLVAERLIQTTDFDEAGKPTFATFNNVTTPGQFLYRDVDGNGIINADDRQVIGDPNPKFTYGFTNDFTYKKFQLSLFFQGVYGNDVLNLGTAYLSTGLPFLNKLSDYLENRWTPENPTNDIRYTAVGSIQDNLVPGNYYIEDGSYIRLKNVTLSYKIPLKNKIINEFQVALLATNLFTITNYSGFDPEVGVFGGTNLLPSVDMGAYPRSKFFQISLKARF